MHDLTLIGVEDGSLLLGSADGTRYRVPVDDRLASGVRSAATRVPSGERRVAPREIQAHIRAGMSADDVASVTGASLEYVRRFEGPVLAEREYVVESALNVPVHTALDLDGANGGSTFGAVIRDRLQGLGAAGERWAGWKEADGGWIVALSFTADEVDHDARWRFEPKRSALAPLNTEAHTLSQQAEPTGGLIPRLRAVGHDDRSADSSRFDSGAFEVRDSGPFRIVESSPEAAAAAIARAPVDDAPSSQTADLLEALRRRRGERESAPYDEEARAEHPASGSSTGRVRLIDVPLDAFDSEPPPVGPAPAEPSPRDTSPQHFGAQTRTGQRRGRAAMPSWDEIVFGSRGDDDPA